MIDKHLMQISSTFQLDSCLQQNQQTDSHQSESQNCQEKNQENQFNTQKVIKFDQIASQNLSAIYGGISTDPSVIKQNKSQNFQINIISQSQKFKKQLQVDSKLLLPLNSYILNQQYKKQTARKKSSNILIPSNGINLQKLRLSRQLNQKLHQKQKQNMRSLHTQKHVRIKSQQTITYFPEQDPQQILLQQRNHESSFQNIKRLFTQLSRQFQYIGDFSLIRKQIVQLALQKKFIIMQNTYEFVTIKVSSPLDYCQCLLKSCLSFDQSGGVYQLKNSLYKRNKAKFIIISGSQKHYLKFFRKILIKLWNKKQLKLKSQQLVEFFISVEKQTPEMKQLKSQYQRLYNQFSGLKSDMKSHTDKSKSNSIINKFKQNIRKLKSPQKSKKNSSQDKQTQLTQFNKKVNQKFNQLRQKLSSSQNLPQIDQQTQQKQLQAQIYFHQFPVCKLYGFYYNQNFQNYLKIKQKITSTQSLKNIFTYLQIEEQYDLFMAQTDRLNSMKNINQGQQYNPKSCKKATIKTINQPNSKKKASQTITPTIPYFQSIKDIQKLCQNNLPPTKFLTILQKFYKKTQLSYTTLYSQKPVLKLSSMDDELPIMIFVLLMAATSNINSNQMVDQMDLVSGGSEFVVLQRGKIRWKVDDLRQGRILAGEKDSNYTISGVYFHLKIMENRIMIPTNTYKDAIIYQLQLKKLQQNDQFQHINKKKSFHFQMIFQYYVSKINKQKQNIFIQLFIF